MKLIFRGIYKADDQLPKSNLPHNAIKFNEPESMEKITLISSLFLIPAMLLIGIGVFASYLLHGTVTIDPAHMFDLSFTGIIIPLFIVVIPIIPHELLHAVALGRSAEAELFFAPKRLMVFIVSTTPITKRRFIVMSFLPNFVLGWLPFIAWIILPINVLYCVYLFWFSVLSILNGGGDYMNICNAIRQMPKGSVHLHSGMHSYWYIPETETLSTDTIIEDDLNKNVYGEY